MLCWTITSGPVRVSLHGVCLCLLRLSMGRLPSSASLPGRLRQALKKSINTWQTHEQTILKDLRKFAHARIETLFLSATAVVLKLSKTWTNKTKHCTHRPRKHHQASARVTQHHVVCIFSLVRHLFQDILLLSKKNMIDPKLFLMMSGLSSFRPPRRLFETCEASIAAPSCHHDLLGKVFFFSSAMRFVLHSYAADGSAHPSSASVVT